MSIIPALGKLVQEDCELNAILDATVEFGLARATRPDTLSNKETATNFCLPIFTIHRAHCTIEGVTELEKIVN